MPILQIRNKYQILRQMIARAVGRSDLVGIVKNSAIYHILAAAADEDAEQYFQMSRLREVFSILTASGSDLDERAQEIVPQVITRRTSLRASGEVTFTRPGTTGTVVIPEGSLVGAQDTDGVIQFRTTAAGSITPGNTSSDIPVVANEPGARGNVAGGAIIRLISRIPGVTGVSNQNSFTNGRDREEDDRFRARLLAYIQGISRGTPTALRAFALNVQLVDGRVVLFAKVFEPVIPTGQIQLYIDDGTGTTGDVTTPVLEEEVVASASGDEQFVYTLYKPIVPASYVPTKALVVLLNSVAQTEGVDFEIDRSQGKIGFYTPLSAGDNVKVTYTYFGTDTNPGLIGQTQKVIDGVPSNRIAFPGVRAGGVSVAVLPAETDYQSLDARAVVADEYDPVIVQDNVQIAILGYINNLDIGEDVIVAEIIQRAMSVSGMVNFRIITFNGSSTVVDRVIAQNYVARAIDDSIIIN